MALKIYQSFIVLTLLTFTIIIITILNNQKYSSTKFRKNSRNNEIILKYWELRNWFKMYNRSNTKKIPEFLDMQSINLWGDMQGQEGIFEDRIIPQFVWRMQQELNNSRYRLTAKEKYIYTDDPLKYWPEFPEPYSKNMKIENFPNPELDYSFYMNSFKCNLITDLDTNYPDVIVTYGSSTNQPPRGISFNLPWLKFTVEPPYIEQVHKTPGFNRQMVTSYYRQSPIQRVYYKWVYYDLNVQQIPLSAVKLPRNKTKPAAIMVSNCNAANRRLEFVKELQRYIHVDIFGKCGNLTCPGNDCNKIIQFDYYFYLAFENSNCRDYISEKFFFNGLQNNAIPIALGAHPDDYKQLAPANSYIHVENFKSPKLLATYLYKLIANETMYKEYFRWQGTGEFVVLDFFSMLCPMLYYDKQIPKYKWFEWKEDYIINKHGEPMCLERGEWYWE